MNRTLVRVLLFVALLLPVSVTGCRDTCGDVVCGPVPPALVVSVSDTVMVDTTLQLLQGGEMTAVDTTLKVRRQTREAMVRLLRVNGVDTVAFDTLAVTGTLYQRVELAGLPQNQFLIVASRNGRSDTVENAAIRNVGGCCPYQTVGRFDLSLPE